MLAHVGICSTRNPWRAPTPHAQVADGSLFTHPTVFPGCVVKSALNPEFGAMNKHLLYLGQQPYHVLGM